jgi:ATP-grasp domain
MRSPYENYTKYLVPRDEAVVIVTPYSTGCCIAQEVSRRGYNLICIWNLGFSEAMKKHCPTSCLDLTYYAELTEKPTLEETVAAVKEAARPYRIVACMCGGEAGLDLTDAISEQLDLLTNGTAIPQRRNKQLQQELIHAAGLRSIRQAGGATISDVDKFLLMESYPLVVKPVDSAGSDGVKLCQTYKEANKHFQYLTDTHTMVNGGSCKAALCQEFLRGKEYVVDHVSRDGCHKCVMVWAYDKRPANGAPFVYFGLNPVDSESPEAKLMIPYVRRVLDILGIQHGPTHAEVILTSNGPCLVEMNCRAHGGDGNWQPLCRALTGGYTQVDAAVDSYLNQEEFWCLPDKPPSPFCASGLEVDLVSYAEGFVTSTPGFDKIKELDSFVSLETHVKPGSKVAKTVDLVTDVAYVILIHPSKDVLEKDVALIRRMEKENKIFKFLGQEYCHIMERPPRGSHHRRLSGISPTNMRHRRLSTIG